LRILHINIFGNLSTGRIATDLCRSLSYQGNEGMVAFARNTIDKDISHYKIGNASGVYIDGICTRLTDRAGFFSKEATRKLIRQIELYDPDIIHLHNLHGYYINVDILFEYLKKSGKPIVWTLHDCWAFTGHCCHYDMVGCDRWKYGCHDCPQKKTYPKSIIFDNSSWNYQRKKELFTSVDNLHLVCVSKWLENQVKQSFLKKVPCKTIYNGIDLQNFKPTQSRFRQQHNIEDKYMILGVASTWSERKGLNDFIRLAEILPDECRVVLVGIRNKERKHLSKKILSVERIDNLNDLAGLYSTADVFLNTSVEETFGLPTVEAMACGTPAIVYDSTALPELISEEVGRIIPSHDLASVCTVFKEVSKLDSENIVTYAQKFSKNRMVKEYLDLYEKIRG